MKLLLNYQQKHRRYITHNNRAKPRTCKKFIAHCIHNGVRCSSCVSDTKLLQIIKKRSEDLIKIIKTSNLNNINVDG